MMTLGPYQLGYNDTPECGIYHGDARELSQAIPDESIDLIFTDPVYDRIDDYRWLAETAARVLKPGGVLLVWTGKLWANEVVRALDSSSLIYTWQLCHLNQGKQSRFRKYGVFERWQLCYWYTKGEYSPCSWFPDAAVTTVEHKGFHGWGKQAHMTESFIGYFAPSVIFDPFTGGGTVPAVCKQLGRQYLAFEIDADTVTLARQRVHDTQPPLFVPQAEQLRLPTT